MFQNSINYLEYIKEYWQLIYNYYSQEYVPYICTYYNFDRQNSVVENKNLMGGSYQLLGDKTGWRWNRIFFLPVFFVEPIQNIPYTSDQRGVINEVETSVVLPNTYNIKPYEHDLLMFINNLSPDPNEEQILWEVKTVERDIISSMSFYKLSLSILKYDKELIDNQVSNDYVFVDYLKTIYNYDMGLNIISTLGSYQELNEYTYNLIDNNSLINFGE